MKAGFALLFLLLLPAGCMVGPNYKRPTIPVPGQYRGAPQAAPESPVADTKWPDLFQDEVLTQLISTSLQHNFDLGIAAERVQEAREQFRITRAGQFPSAGAEADFVANRQSTVGSLTFVPRDASLAASYTQAGVAVSWELDLWGRLRRLSESARAQCLASEEGRRGVIVSLIGDVAGDYLTLRELDLELQIGESTQKVAEDNLRLVQLRHERGAATGLDVHQAEQLLYTATAQIAGTQREIGKAENALSLLLGRPPGRIARGKAINDLVLPAQIPAGLPSSLLERRPDIRQAEQTLIAANAQIGVAKSYYYPQISLTGFLLGQSRALSELFTGPARFWNATAGIVAPLFTGGALRANVRLTEAQKREMVIAYQKTIYNAFREVSDALIAYDRTREQLKQQELLVQALRATVELSALRYKGGLDSYLQVLVAERSLFVGQIALAQLRLQQLLAYVQVYRALGGGW